MARIEFEHRLKGKPNNFYRIILPLLLLIPIAYVSFFGYSFSTPNLDKLDPEILESIKEQIREAADSLSESKRKQE